MRQQGLRVHSGATERRGRGQTERLHQRVRKVNASSSSGASRAEARWPGGGDVGFSETWAGQMPLPAGAQLGRGGGRGSPERPSNFANTVCEGACARLCMADRGGEGGSVDVRVCQGERE